jgi:hypothetical protein
MDAEDFFIGDGAGLGGGGEDGGEEQDGEGFHG